MISTVRIMDHQKAYLYGLLVSVNKNNCVTLNTSIEEHFEWIANYYERELFDVLYTRQINNTQNVRIYFHQSIVDSTSEINDIFCSSVIDDTEIVDIVWSFVRGMFDAQGVITMALDKPFCHLTSHHVEFIQNLSHFCQIPCKIYELLNNSTDTRIEFTNTNAIDFLSKLYLYSKCPTIETNNYLQFINLLHKVHKQAKLQTCKIWRVNNDAILPSKVRESDVGYDLTIIKKHKQLNSVTALYDTGIKLDIPFGMYVEVAPRSSLSKSGYMLSNSIGIIDPSYVGNIYVALTKVDPDAPEIEFPFRCCQLIFKEQKHVNIVETTEQLENTGRGDGGFGSTNL